MNIILFGAGKVGMEFVKNSCFKKLELENNNIYFFDNNRNASKVINGINRLSELETIPEDTEIIITCKDWIEVYRDCIQRGYKNIKIYDEKNDNILTVKEYCRCNAAYYENVKYAEYQNEKNAEILKNKEKFLQTKDLFGSITEVAIMLSNLCNYATIHKKCPASCIKEKQIMPSRLVYKILDELATKKFHGTICFHIYNEPLIDPRLFIFIQYVKRTMPDAKVKIYSNGYYLNQTMLKELDEIGTDILNTTGYGKDEYERLVELGAESNMAFSVLYGSLDNRMDNYTKRNTEQAVSTDVCNTYLVQIPIYVTGAIGTCCLDYMHPYELGNVEQFSLEECLRNNRVIDFQMRLLQGKRTDFPICANCNWKR